MSDLISRSALLRYIEDQIDESKEELDDARARGNENDVSYNHGEIAEARRIKSHVNMCAPTIDAVPVVHARWNHNGPNFIGGVDWYSCSACGNQDAVEWMKYCPACGAKMDGGAEG